MAKPLKIFFSCSGVGVIYRGIESFFREAFEGLRHTEGLDLTLYKGAGNEKADERVLWNIPRTSKTAKALGRIIGRSSYATEQLTTLPSMVRAIRREKPDIIYYSDANLGFQLYRWRKQIGVPYRLLFSNGGPVHPPFDRTDYVHQVTPFYYDEAIAAGESPKRQRMVPYGISVPSGDPEEPGPIREKLRRQLGLPFDRRIVLSVGWISAIHKRMDYVVREIARLPMPRPFLLMLGAIDKESEQVMALARDRLGEENFAVRSVIYQQVDDYYRGADLFVLASLKEGFGRVFLEALIHGLPVIAHDHPVARFVLGEEGIFGDLTKEGALATLISVSSRKSVTLEEMRRRRARVRERFSWPVLAPQYREMFYDCFAKVHPFKETYPPGFRTVADRGEACDLLFRAFVSSGHSIDRRNYRKASPIL